jgi:hypothetical protein
MSSTTFLRLAERLLVDPAAKDAYATDREAFLEREGFGALSPEEIEVGLQHVSTVVPPSVAEAIDPEAGFDGLADLDLADLGVDGLDDFRSPLDTEDLPAEGLPGDDADLAGGGDLPTDAADIDGLAAAAPAQHDGGHDGDEEGGAHDVAPDLDELDDLDDLDELDGGDDGAGVAGYAPAVLRPIDIDELPPLDGTGDGGFTEDDPGFAPEVSEPALAGDDVPDDERWDLFDL